MAGEPTTTAQLPPQREDAPPRTPYRVALVCLGNICRSPMAEVVLDQALRQQGLGSEVALVSAGTGGWHVGNPMDRRAAAALTARGYDASLHRAQQFDSSWFAGLDLVLVMDSDNLAEVVALAEDPADRDRVRMFRDHDPLAGRGDRDVPDPYYGGDDGFDHVLALVTRTAQALAQDLAQFLTRSPAQAPGGRHRTDDDRRAAEG